jgi:hypothetical protein
MQPRRESHGKIVRYTVNGKALPLPGKIMMMRYNRNTGFRNQLSQGKAQRNIHRDCLGILGNQ